MRIEHAHAASMLAAAVLSLVMHDVRFAAVAGAAALVVYVVRARARWTPSGAFGVANATTLARAALVLAFGCLGAHAVGPVGATLVMLAFALDGVDGWIARRTGTTSAFGARFDVECDAWMVLVASLALYVHGRLGGFILAAGFLRYLYVLALVLLPRTRGEEPPSRTGRWAFSLLAVSLVASLWPLVPWHAPLAMVATGFLCLSFARSMVWSLLAVSDSE